MKALPYSSPTHRVRTGRRVRKALAGACCYGFYCKSTELVKLGRTSDVFRRWAKLETDGGRLLQLVAVWQVADCAIHERALHERFCSDRQLGEWFTATPVLLMLGSLLG